MQMNFVECEDLPSWCVILQILALSFEHATSHFDGRWMILARINNVGYLSNWAARVDHLVVVCREFIPFVVFGHSNRSLLQFLGGVVSIVGFAAENASQNVVCLLDLSNYNRLEFAPGCFQIQVGLDRLAVKLMNLKQMLSLTRWR